MMQEENTNAKDTQKYVRRLWKGLKSLECHGYKLHWQTLPDLLWSIQLGAGAKEYLDLLNWLEKETALNFERNETYKKIAKKLAFLRGYGFLLCISHLPTSQANYRCLLIETIINALLTQYKYNKKHNIKIEKNEDSIQNSSSGSSKIRWDYFRQYSTDDTQNFIQVKPFKYDNLDEALSLKPKNKTLPSDESNSEFFAKYFMNLRPGSESTPSRLRDKKNDEPKIKTSFSFNTMLNLRIPLEQLEASESSIELEPGVDADTFIASATSSVISLHLDPQVVQETQMDCKSDNEQGSPAVRLESEIMAAINETSGTPDTQSNHSEPGARSEAVINVFSYTKDKSLVELKDEFPIRPKTPSMNGTPVTQSNFLESASELGTRSEAVMNVYSYTEEQQLESIASTAKGESLIESKDDLSVKFKTSSTADVTLGPLSVVEVEVKMYKTNEEPDTQSTCIISSDVISQGSKPSLAAKLECENVLKVSEIKKGTETQLINIIQDAGEMSKAFDKVETIAEISETNKEPNTQSAYTISSDEDIARELKPSPAKGAESPNVAEVVNVKEEKETHLFNSSLVAEQTTLRPKSLSINVNESKVADGVKTSDDPDTYSISSNAEPPIEADNVAELSDVVGVKVNNKNEANVLMCPEEPDAVLFAETVQELYTTLKEKSSTNREASLKTKTDTMTEMSDIIVEQDTRLSHTVSITEKPAVRPDSPSIVEAQHEVSATVEIIDKQDTESKFKSPTSGELLLISKTLSTVEKETGVEAKIEVVPDSYLFNTNCTIEQPSGQPEASSSIEESENKVAAGECDVSNSVQLNTVPTIEIESGREPEMADELDLSGNHSTIEETSIKPESSVIVEIESKVVAEEKEPSHSTMAEAEIDVNAKKAQISEEDEIIVGLSEGIDKLHSQRTCKIYATPLAENDEMIEISDNQKTIPTIEAESHIRYKAIEITCVQDPELNYTCAIEAMNSTPRREGLSINQIEREILVETSNTVETELDCATSVTVVSPAHEEQSVAVDMQPQNFETERIASPSDRSVSDTSSSSLECFNYENGQVKDYNQLSLNDLPEAGCSSQSSQISNTEDGVAKKNNGQNKDQSKKKQGKGKKTRKQKKNKYYF